MTSSKKNWIKNLHQEYGGEDLGLNLPEKDIAGADLIARVSREIIAAFVERCKSKGLTKADLAKKLDVDRSVITKMLRGNANLTLRTIGELCWALDIRPDFIFSDSTHPEHDAADVGQGYAFLLVDGMNVRLIDKALAGVAALDAPPSTSGEVARPSKLNYVVRGGDFVEHTRASRVGVFVEKQVVRGKAYAH